MIVGVAGLCVRMYGFRCASSPQAPLNLNVVRKSGIHVCVTISNMCNDNLFLSLGILPPLDILLFFCCSFSRLFFLSEFRTGLNWLILRLIDAPLPQ